MRSSKSVEEFSKRGGSRPQVGLSAGAPGTRGSALQSFECCMTDIADGMTWIAEPGDRAGREKCVGSLRLPQSRSSTPSHLRQRDVMKYGAPSRVEPVHLEPRSHRGMRTGEMKHQGCIAQSRPKSCRTLWTVIRD